MDAVLKTAHEWEKESTDNYMIYDPDGFRQNDGVTMDTPITFEDYKERKTMCTVGPWAKGAFGRSW